MLEFQKMPENITLLEWLGRADGQIALVFTDIVGSTKLAVSKGDDEWVKALKCHFRRARDLKEELHGYEVKLIGDACMMAFKTAWPALKFALEFYRFTGHDDIKIRAAVHVGEVTIVDNDMYGVMINYTSRLLKGVSGTGLVVSDKAMQNIRGKLGTNFQEHFSAVGPGKQSTLTEFPPKGALGLESRPKADPISAMGNNNMTTLREASS
jgi:class 3 adenylate cyclase